jgi:signal transduction histidine kinase
MQKIMARMRSFATEVLEPKDVDLHFHFDEELKDVHLNMEERRDLFLLFKESINNAAKYSNASKVFVDMHLKNKTLQLKVQDNGIGFNLNEADSGNGLNNMQKRAEKLNAKYSIHSEPRTGTTMLLEMQIT